MIITQLPNSAPAAAIEGNTFKVTAFSFLTPRVLEENDICICDFVQCPYEEKVFALSGGQSYQKDKSEFLFRRLTSFDTIEIKLFKEGVEVADLNDNTYGTFFNGFASGSAEQQLYVGYLLEWDLVRALNGVGKYTVRVNTNVIGNSNVEESRVFDLRIYSDLAAHQTVKIESTQNGNIIGNDLDYTDLNWQQFVRVPGVFGNPTPTYEEDRYVTESHDKRQIKDTMSREWFLETKKINFEVAEKLIYNKLMANEILITDYNIYAESIFRDITVMTKDISKPDTSGNPDKIYNVTFVDVQNKFQKRNF